MKTQATEGKRVFNPKEAKGRCDRMQGRVRSGFAEAQPVLGEVKDDETPGMTAPAVHGRMPVRYSDQGQVKPAYMPTVCG